MSDLNQGRMRPEAGAEAPAALARFLRAEHPSKTAEAVAARTGIARDTVANWLKLRHPPSLSHFLRLTLAYGPGLIAAVLPARAGAVPDWLELAVGAHDHARMAAQVAALQERMRRTCASRAAPWREPES